MEKQRNKKEKYLMALCVLAPMAVLVLLILGRSGSINIGSYLPYALFLLCPLSHFLLMPLMHKNMEKRSDAGESGINSSCH